MKVLLVQPPDPPAPVKPVALAGADPPLFAPPWDLLCLRSYLLLHTRHLAAVIDCRTFADLETELAEAIRAEAEPRLLVVSTTSHALGQSAAVLEIARRDFPGMKTVLCGEFPSQFPEQVAAVTRVDYALAGDPEPILRNLLDYMDVPQRLQRVPGLIREGA
ncbi:MAG: cobalamin-dependent protein, partial [Kiritimatiellae bacterium]|nr:cobalamin-dependent protein [Kiritimatiellia bacterium]